MAATALSNFAVPELNRSRAVRPPTIVETHPFAMRDRRVMTASNLFACFEPISPLSASDAQKSA
jgi:hypothetical protein